MGGNPVLGYPRHRLMDWTCRLVLTSWQRLHLWGQNGVAPKPDDSNAVRHHANYILRQGSKDLGSTILEGSRNGSSMMLYAAIHLWTTRLSTVNWPKWQAKAVELTKTSDVWKQQSLLCVFWPIGYARALVGESFQKRSCKNWIA